MADTNSKKRRQITVVDKDGSISEKLEAVKAALNSKMEAITLSDSDVIRSLIVSAFNKYNREIPERINLENQF